MPKEDTQFKKGMKKTGGRKAGVPNVITRETKNILAPVMQKYFGGEGIGEKRYTLEKDLEKMEPEDRAKVVSSLAGYFIPKLSSVEVKEKEAKKSFQDELDELSEEQEKDKDK